MQQSQIHILVRSFLDNTLDKEGQRQFYELLKDPTQRELLSETFMNQTGSPDMQLAFDESLLPILNSVLEADRTEPAKVVKLDTSRRANRWIWIAASVLLLVIAGNYWLSSNHDKDPVQQQMAALNIPPGSEGAVLTLADGSQMLLDSLTDGVIAREQGADILLKDQQLSYESRKTIATQAAYNTIATPKGRQYQFRLSDGTGVWLNAGSSITFPAVFNGTKERNVKITGEVYFEVAKKNQEKGKKIPFTVGVGTANTGKYMEITVLGTHFNVNAYSDEPQVRATLLEGSIKIKKKDDVYLLQPGQQAYLLDSTNAISIIDNINEEEIIAWKNGYFYFDHTDLQSVMRQLARWYDVTIEYRGNIPDLKFVGEIPRSANLEEVFQILGKTRLRFTVEGKKIIVNP